MSKPDEVLNTLHLKGALVGLINDGKPHKLESHGNDDSCVRDAKQFLFLSIMNILPQDENGYGSQSEACETDGFNRCNRETREAIRELFGVNE